MSTTAGLTFTLNGANYDGSQLSPEGQQLLALLTEAQGELTRLEKRKALLKAAQQQLLERLKPMLAAPSPAGASPGPAVLGEASRDIPATGVEKPELEPAAPPADMPEAIRAR